MPIEVTSIAGGKIRLWKHKGRVTLQDALAAISHARATQPGGPAAQELLVYEPGAFADVSAGDLRRMVDAAIEAFPGRYQGAIKCAVVVGRLNFGIAKLFCSVLDADGRIEVPAFVFPDCRYALDWLGIAAGEIDAVLREIGPVTLPSL